MVNQNLLAEIGRLLIEFQISQMKKAGNITRQDEALPAESASQSKSTGKGHDSMSAGREAKK